LAFCCHVYAGLERYDSALAELRASTGPTVDPAEANHRKPLFDWLRRWGCRQFNKEAEPLADQSLVGWWGRWSTQLGHPVTSLQDVDAETLERIGAGYEDLRSQLAGGRVRAGSPIGVSYGPTGASKTLFAMRPNLCVPWDDKIRVAYGLSTGGEGYREFLKLTKDLLTTVAEEFAVSWEQIPGIVGRPSASPVKLVDEYNWTRFSRKVSPPSVETLEQWWHWAAAGSQGTGNP
jgi:hypothetical protein